MLIELTLWWIACFAGVIAGNIAWLWIQRRAQERQLNRERTQMLDAAGASLGCDRDGRNNDEYAQAITGAIGQRMGATYPMSPGGDA